VWFWEAVGPDEVAFDADVFLLPKAKAEALKAAIPAVERPPEPGLTPTPEPSPTPVSEKPVAGASSRTLRLVGTVPPELWNRLWTKILAKLRSGTDLRIGVDFSVTVRADGAAGLTSDLRLILRELGLAETVRVE
jgi:hypothetical protein